ncbi:MAG: hypothetical protein KF691_12110 [Phycisphaeraceae bacterium]|nr:hypothetical protein [Phycisphaeraceae bacterium]
MFSAWRLPVHDDAGVARELLPMRSLPSGTARLDRVRDKAHLVYSDLTSFRRLMIRVIVLAVPMGIAMPFVMLWLRPAGVPLPVISACAGLLMALVLRVWMRRDFAKLAARAPEIADACLDEGICPCCGYNLAGVVSASEAAPESGKVVRCTECGASWFRSRVHRIEWDETADAREKPTMRTILRAQSMLYSSMAFKDDAGKAVSLARFSDLKLVRNSASGLHRARLDDCIRTLRYKGLWKRLLFASLVLPLLIAIISDFATRPLSGIGLLQGLQAIGLVVWLIGAVAIIQSDMGRSGAKRAALLKSYMLCPACGADLESRIGREPGAATCAECRAAWNVTPRAPQQNAGTNISSPAEPR